MARKQNPAQQPQPFESDTQRIVHLHLADPNHVITDEELASVRIGMTPPPDATAEQAIDDAEDRVADKKTLDEAETIPGTQKTTPWDVIDES